MLYDLTRSFSKFTHKSDKLTSPITLQMDSNRVPVLHKFLYNSLYNAILWHFCFVSNGNKVFFSILAFNLVSIPDYNFTIESKKIIGDGNYS